MKTEENIEEFIETFEDISIKSEKGHDLFQLKLTGTPKKINDNSDEFWKTLRNWAYDVKEGNIDLEKSNFIIITMNKAEKNSIPYFLKPGINQHTKALEEINKKGPIAGNKDIREKYYPQFQKLDGIIQNKLIKKISILDSSPTLKNLKDKIKFFIASDTEDEFVNRYYTDLYGWWRNKIQEILDSDTQNSISWSELRQVRKELSSNYRKKIFMSTVTKKDVKMKISFSNKMNYVKQLIAIGKKDKTILDAKYDYEMTKYQNIVWIGENPGYDSRIKKFENTVKTDYNHKFNSNQDTITSRSNDDLVRWGYTMYDWAMFQTDWKISENTDGVHKRGTLHILADIPKIGWHPEYEKELEKMKK